MGAFIVSDGFDSLSVPVCARKHVHQSTARASSCVCIVIDVLCLALISVGTN